MMKKLPVCRLAGAWNFRRQQATTAKRQQGTFVREMLSGRWWLFYSVQWCSAAFGFGCQNRSSTSREVAEVLQLDSLWAVVARRRVVGLWAGRVEQKHPSRPQSRAGGPKGDPVWAAQPKLFLPGTLVLGNSGDLATGWVVVVFCLPVPGGANGETGTPRGELTIYGHPGTGSVGGGFLAGLNGPYRLMARYSKWWTPGRVGGWGPGRWLFPGGRFNISIWG